MLKIEAPYLIYLGDTQIPEMAKTGAGLAYWRPERCAGQLREPGCAADLGLPDLDLNAAVQQGVKTLVIGTAIPGGQLPDSWITRIVEAMEAGMDIASGLHSPLRSIPALDKTAKETGRNIYDVRLSHGPHPIANGRKRSGQRLLTVGTDCAVGKKYSALALHRELLARDVSATFRATGQTGVLIDGQGLAIDAVVSDFIAGAVEALAPSADDAHWDVIEGQGSLVHPAYAGVSLGLLHGAQPDAFVVCHEYGRKQLSGFEDHRVGSIEHIISLTEQLGRIVSKEIRCAGISLNTSSLSEQEALNAIQEIKEQYGLPVCDPVRFGVKEIIDDLLSKES
ncbi:DUF1611 domain-containing protein [Cohaesibacter gelatinilyticus]|uniref:Uncharacterized conserved protein, NAD-dependent epimerase/dehydratase family n=1 Tax=Cohaesibacter gelatinilyticus TaxID=372072 RepID=A0A285PKZ0_9HYPH|nr:DUF1611 domain-containing protein [Cohaesibacter gelatinilyticus]SNZ20541.1 Uncharacterized conserved protein, NAD-dependent epimerase/dehydratase family [Cohaesibacter gelatinilyticus]HAT87859.1 DUF1611 domain-containing protein [Hyphomicrobiales bacterium]